MNRWNVVVVVGAMLSTAQANELEKHKAGFRERDPAPGAVPAESMAELPAPLIARVRADQRDRDNGAYQRVGLSDAGERAAVMDMAIRGGIRQ